MHGEHDDHSSHTDHDEHGGHDHRGDLSNTIGKAPDSPGGIGLGLPSMPGGPIEQTLLSGLLLRKGAHADADVIDVTAHNLAAELPLEPTAALRSVQVLNPGDQGSSMSRADLAKALCNAGYRIVLDADTTPSELNDVLAVIVHTCQGIHFRARTAAQVVRALHCVTCALSGFSVDEAASADYEPAVARLRRLRTPAVEAVRDIVNHIYVDDPESIEKRLRADGLA